MAKTILLRYYLMIDVFISRPTCVAEDFQSGLTGFLSFLDTHDIKSRTLGSTDYPTESPLDEVIKIMDDCKGVIILGYPQINMLKGEIKGKETKNLLLPTEWNHIEATVAYIKKLPLLVIHHKGITRGIFEHGAISKFIYEKDFSKPNWFLDDNIKGAIKKWKSSITELRSVADAMNTTTDNILKKSQSSKTSLYDNRLEKQTESILIFLFEEDREHYRTDYFIGHRFNISKQRVIYFLEILIKHGLIIESNIYYSASETQTAYSLTSDGRKYIMSNHLVKS